MAEGEAVSPMVEALAESKVVRAVVGAVDRTQQRNTEYWEIRKTIQDRLKWHGGGVYKQHVQNMDTVINALYKRPDASFWDKVKSFSLKTAARLEGRLLQVSSATLDFFYNSITWLPRKFLPAPKDVFKRMALGVSVGRAAGQGVALGAVEGWMGGVKAIKRGADTVRTAPEVAATMLKRRVDSVVDQIRNPNRVEKAGMKLKGIK